MLEEIKNRVEKKKYLELTKDLRAMDQEEQEKENMMK